MAKSTNKMFVFQTTPNLKHWVDVFEARGGSLVYQTTMPRTNIKTELDIDSVEYKNYAKDPAGYMKAKYAKEEEVYYGNSLGFNYEH